MDVDDTHDIRTKLVDPDVQEALARRLEVFRTVYHVRVPIDLDDVSGPRVAQANLIWAFALDKHRVVLEPVADMTEGSMRHVISAENPTRLGEVLRNLSFSVKTHCCCQLLNG